MNTYYEITRDREGKDVVMKLTAQELFELCVEDLEQQQVQEDAELYCEHEDAGDRV